MDLFDQLTRGVIGYERLYELQRKMASNAKAVGNFPFYNIKRMGENKYKIELALAGYSISDLDITLDKNTLSISGSMAEDDLTDYIYKGFASRKFNRQFTLMDNIKIGNAELVNGILSIWLEEFVRDEDKPKKININQPSADSHPQLLNETSNF